MMKKKMTLKRYLKKNLGDFYLICFHESTEYSFVLVLLLQSRSTEVVAKIPTAPYQY